MLVGSPNFFRNVESVERSSFDLGRMLGLNARLPRGSSKPCGGCRRACIGERAVDGGCPSLDEVIKFVAGVGGNNHGWARSYGISIRFCMQNLAVTPVR